MSKRIFINGGHGGKDSGATGYGLLEKNLTHKIATRVTNELLRKYKGIKIKNYPSDNSYVSLSSISRTANKFKPDIFVSIHINAGGGTGFESFVYNGRLRGLTQTLQNNVHGEIIKATSNYKVVDRGKKQANFHVLREVKAPCVLTENMFIDNKNDSALLKERAFIDRIVEGHVNGIAKTLNLKKKAIAKTNKYYRVVTGSFNNRKYANKRVKELKEKGYDSFIDVFRK